MFVNPAPVPVAVLLVHRKGDLVDGHQVLQVGAHAKVPVSVPAESIIENLVPLDVLVPLTRLPVCSSGASRMRLTPALIHEELAIQAHADADNARQQEGIASAKGAIELEQYFDEVRTQRSDPLQAELHSEQLRDASPQGAAQIARNDQQQQTQQLVADTVAMAMANGEVITAHSNAAGKEAEERHAMVENKKTYLTHLDAVYSATQTTLAAGRALNDQSAAELRTAADAHGIAGGRVEEFGRVCGGAALDKDLLALRMDVPEPLAVLIGKAHFNRGGEESVIFRRIRGTQQWVAAMYWPLEASKASVRLETGQAKLLGDVNTGRSSVKDELASAHKSLAPVKRAERSARYAAEGGDENKTVIVP